MSDDISNTTATTELRRKAEEQVALQAELAGELDARRPLHELQVHQVELEMQNEEMRRSLAELNEHKSHLENIIQNTPAGYFHIDREGRFLGVNNAWLRMHGYDSADEVIGKHFSIMQVDSSSYSALDHMDDLLKGKPIPFGEFTSRRRDGSVGHHIFSAHPVVNFGQLTGFEWFIIDISDRKKLEQEKQILERQFQQAQKMESLGVLAGGIAHDFNNILAIIMGYCGLTKMDYDTAEKHIPLIENAVERAAALCRQMLAYAGKATLTQTLVSMWALVDEVVNMMRATARQNVVFRTNYSPDILSITGDASQLRQVVMNLLINASEAIGDTQGEVQVSLSRTVIEPGQSKLDHLGTAIPGGAYIFLDVTDNGCGMSDDVRGKFFEPFFTTKFTGRGLGMSAVLGIINAHKGALQFDSQPGRGTTFKVYLPVQPRIEEVEKTTPHVEMDHWKGTGTVLLVEDEEQLLTMLKFMLHHLGFTTLNATNGKEALELFIKHADDITLVVTDLDMPVMDGCELIRELKKLRQELPIIVSSGLGDEAVTAQAQVALADIAGMISKPFNFEKLRDVLKSVVEADSLAK
ncbi:MAG TPA: response regulator [Desulfuromonadales bacterium]|nr:response regulator [Desulfuromonadales bacterium]